MTVYPFFLDYFFNPNFFYLFFGIIFLWNIPMISSRLKSLITYVHDTEFLTFRHRNFFRPTWIVTFSKIFSYFDIVLGKVNICVWVYISTLYFNNSLIWIVVFDLICRIWQLMAIWPLTISANLSIYTFLDTKVIYF